MFGACHKKKSFNKFKQTRLLHSQQATSFDNIIENAKITICSSHSKFWIASKAFSKAFEQSGQFISACLETVSMYFSALPSLHNSVIVLFEFPSVT